MFLQPGQFIRTARDSELQANQVVQGKVNDGRRIDGGCRIDGGR